MQPNLDSTTPECNKEGRSVASNVLQSSRTYRLTQVVTKVMDAYYIDPIVGFFFPVFGDIITAAFACPCLYLSIFKLRSLPLTLALIYNILFDVFVGIIPAYIGDLLDAFNKAHVKNLRLIKGYAEADKRVISEVNRKAVYFALLILLMLTLITFVILFFIQVVAWLSEAWNWIVGLI